MTADRYDALVVGSGPAGSVAALVLARGGARVALVDKGGFPRDKACGDLVGPRGVQLLADLGIDVPGAARVGDMLVVGPRRAVRLPCRPGRTYPGFALAVPRVRFDALLHDAAVEAGAEPFRGRAVGPLGDGHVDGCVLADGRELRADALIGADGAVSGVAEWAGLVDPARVLWGFALRAYVDEPVELPQIFFWEPTPWRVFPGYGWVFPGPDGRANVGLGCGVQADRAAGAQAARRLPAFLADLVARGVLRHAPSTDGAAALGGWLKLGMVGTRPAAGRVLLVGDAAGLVNPLQGEGISQAMGSARAAADALLRDPGWAADAYRDALATCFAPYEAVTAPVHAAMLARPWAVSAVARTLTSPGLGRALAGGWGVFWNDLLAGAAPGPPRTVAAAAQHGFRAATAAGATRRWFRTTFGPGGQFSPASSGKSAKSRALPG